MSLTSVAASKKRVANQKLCGILNINKPSGITSHGVVARVRKITGQRRVGHAGTLDPMATGVLLVCLGQATRVAEYLMAGDKIYRARIRLGITTDTYDAEGRVTNQAEVNVTRADVERELSGFVGSLELMPPIYSAIKYQGTPLYRFARRGHAIARQMRKVTIHAIKLIEWTPPELEVEVHCGKGTYIRSLAHELGQRLNCGAHLTGLTRIASGCFRLEDAITLEELEQAFAKGEWSKLLHPLDVALQAFPVVFVDRATEKRLYVGQRVRLPEAPSEYICRAYADDGRLLALLRCEADGLWQPYKVFSQ